MPIVIEEPVSPRLFSDEAETFAASRTAFLLLLGILFGSTNDEALLDDVLTFRDRLELPDPRPGARFNPSAQRHRLVERFNIDPFTIGTQQDQVSSAILGQRRGLLTELINNLYGTRDAETAFDILILSLGDLDERVRAAAAVSLFDVLDEFSIPIRTLLNILETSDDELAGKLAEIALHRFATSLLRRVPGSPQSPVIGPRTATVIIHGSQFGWVGQKVGTWWQPGGDFHGFIKDNFRPALYSKPDHFLWSGGWNDIARELAARELLSWSRNRGFSSLEVLAHSHGGNIAMRATQLGLELSQLVLMSCPVHWPHYQPDFSQVKSIVSHQINLDLVILADRGRTRFNHPKVVDHVLPRWFWSHEDSHSPDIWKQYSLSL